MTNDANNDANKNIEIADDADAMKEQLFGKTQAEKYKKPFLAALGVIVAVVGGYMIYKWQVQQQEEKAQVELFPAVFYFDKDSLDKALNGDGNTTTGFVKIADEYSLTKAGNLANFYAGASKLKKGDYDGAITHLNKFSSSDLLFQARAYCLTGDAYMQKKDFENAASFYKKAAEYKPNQFTTPFYLFKLGLACEKKSDWSGAQAAYKRITEEFRENADYARALKYLNRVETVMNGK
jgi:tetratricopeptide (TPR) repeat protein